ncbi:CheR family methyltransferase [Methylorubrum extorquens]|uniref:CheR family methyltransferase n=1 Tax=Methylorubrum extorquens TaxID=408 RepID=UPI001EE62218|nr:protein-glutamate O-methyltransferase CheR [Methylorubrum extorquens]MCG5244913.1 protein-glutamate O-methyltransferase CheR [Methylorubrum extorquens]
MTAPIERSRRVASATVDPGFPALKDRVIARTGHNYYEDKDDLLYDRLRKRMRSRGVADCAAYSSLLDGAAGREEWAALEAEITIGETFFFRYAEQFAALRKTILPELIEARSEIRRLRIWSAGCSTGAEPYSLAILVHDLLGEALADWSVTILGTDLSAGALAVAREAEFGPWALRTLDTEERARWFRRTPARPGLPHGGYALRPAFRRMVRFERQNLLTLIDGSDRTQGGFDLILCRNVLIYFSTDHVTRIVRALGERLNPQGWLLIGHAEPNPTFSQWLQPVALPGTVAYRPIDTPVPPPPPVLVSALPDLAPIPVAPPPEPAPAAAAPALPVPIPRPAPPAIAHPLSPGDLLAEIRVLADAGETARAWRRLHEEIDGYATDSPLRYYEGLLALDLGREREAERALRGALFLDRGFVMAHFQLGLLLARVGRRGEAARALDNALRLAQGLPPETILPEGDGVSAARLAESARRALAGITGRDA